MLLHTFANILVKKLFGNNLVGRFPYVSHTNISMVYIHDHDTLCDAIRKQTIVK